MFGADAGAERVGAYSPVVLTRILKRTSEEGRSGALHVVSGASLKTVHFDRGAVRFAASNIRNDRLGESMLAHDFISREDYALAVERMRNERCRFGEALLQLGRLTEEELNHELAIQVQRIVLSLFRISEGTYSYEDSETSERGRLPFQLPVPPLLLKGLRAITDGKLILSALPPASTRVRSAAKLPRGIRLEKLSPSERSVLEIAGEGAEIGEIAQRSELDRGEAFRCCFILLSLGLLEPVASLAPTAEDAAPASSDLEPSRQLIDEPAPDPRDFARRERIEQLARDARLHVQVRDWQGGIPLLLELVSLEPRRAEFQGMLGKLMQHSPSMRKNAEQHFLEAVRLAPDDVALHLDLARYYLSTSNRAKTRSEIQTALDLDPGNAEALKLVDSLREPSSISKFFNKVFR